MNYIEPIEGMNFSPIAEYNNYLKGNTAFSVNSDLSFETILDKQTKAIKQNSSQIKGGIEVNSAFDDALVNASNSRVKQDSAASFLNSFGNSIGSGLNSVNNNAKAFEKAQEAFAMGENVSVHDVMIASEKSALSMQLAMQLRNKIITAYNEINNVKV